MPDQLNIASLTQKPTPLSSDRMLIWKNEVTELGDLQYVTYGQLAASVTALIEAPVAAALTDSFIAQPTNKTLAANDIIYHNGTTWIASQTLPTGSVGTLALANNAVTADQINSNAVTNDKVLSIAGEKITTGTISQDRLSTINANKIVSVADSTIPVAAVPVITPSKVTGPGQFPEALIPALPASKIQSGVLPTLYGGTNATGPVGALANLGAYGGATGAAGYRITISTTEPGGATNGDIWFQI